MIELFRDSNFDFVGRRRWAYLISILFILAGLGSMVAKGGLRYGIDFSGGTLIQVRFEKAVAVDRIRHALVIAENRSSSGGRRSVTNVRKKVCGSPVPAAKSSPM